MYYIIVKNETESKIIYYDLYLSQDKIDIHKTVDELLLNNLFLLNDKIIDINEALNLITSYKIKNSHKNIGGKVDHCKPDKQQEEDNNVNKNLLYPIGNKINLSDYQLKTCNHFILKSNLKEINLIDSRHANSSDIDDSYISNLTPILSYILIKLDNDGERFIVDVRNRKNKVYSIGGLKTTSPDLDDMWDYLISEIKIKENYETKFAYGCNDGSIPPYIIVPYSDGEPEILTKIRNDDFLIPKFKGENINEYLEEQKIAYTE